MESYQEKKEAVEKTIKMWEWLAKHPKKEKRDYFEEVEKKGSFLEKPKHDCYLCEIWHEQELNHLVCTECPLAFGSRCEGKEDNIYAKWERTKSAKSKQKYARQIVAKCKEWLEDNKGLSKADRIKEIFNSTAEEIVDILSEDK